MTLSPFLRGVPAPPTPPTRKAVDNPPKMEPMEDLPHTHTTIGLTHACVACEQLLRDLERASLGACVGD